MKRRAIAKRLLAFSVTLLVAAAALSWVVPHCLAGPRLARPNVRSVSPSPPAASVAAEPSPTLRVVTANIAHGRGDGPNQLFRRRATFRRNLDAIAAVLVREQPHVVALQEADGPSFWSGGFDHVSYLADSASYSHSVRAAHVQGPRLTYGTAFVARIPLGDATSVRFDSSPPTTPKGFLVSTVVWPGSGKAAAVDVVSVHLDFARRAVRERQADQLADFLAQRGRPLVVMGDFNCQLDDEEPTLRSFIERLQLTTPESTPGAATFPSSDLRLDWILVSRELEVVSLEVLPDPLSDHRFVLAEVRHRSETPSR